MKVSDIRKTHKEHFVLDINDMIPFLQKQMKHKNRITTFYKMFNAFSLLAVIAIMSWEAKDGTAIMPLLIKVCYGVAIAFLLVPLHEYIHALAYKSVGAKKVNYTANWKKFYFTAQADHFVIDQKAFFRVALAPFVVITMGGCILGIFFADYLIMILAVVMAHAAMCSGDFALMSYFYQHKEQDMLTYDDFSNQKAYFFVK